MRRYLLILLGVLGAIVAVAVFALFRTPTLGLDLRGGLEIVLQAEAPKGQTVDAAGMNRALDIMRTRIDKLGVAEPELRRQGNDQIIVELPGVHDAARAAEIVGTTAQLQFFKLEGDAVGPTKGGVDNPVIPNTSPLPLLTPESQLKAGDEDPNAWYLYGKDKKLIAGPGKTKQDVIDSLPGGTVPKDAKWYFVPSNRIILTCGKAQEVCPGVGVPTQTYYYLYNYDPQNKEKPVPELSGTDLKIDGTRADFQNGQPVVLLDFTNSGGDKFHNITRELSREGRQVAAQVGASCGGPQDERQGALQAFAIVLDGEIRSFPTIDYCDLPDGIAGGSAVISGLSGVGESKDLALVLQTGALPYSFKQLERTDISATLGQDSLHEALIAGIGGLIAVAIFLLLLYRFLGLVAIAGLAIYGVFLYGTILLFNVTLTLPGFAGLVLTIGVAADANVVIFERIKEEVRAGKSVRAAIAAGYKKGFSTIVDGNVVTMITAAILFLIGTGSVRGFALMLLLGTLLSMFTAVAATRALLGVLAGFTWFDNPAFMGAGGTRIPRWQKVDFIGKRRLWFAISGAVVVVCLVSLGVRGLNLGIDFEGGSQATFETSKPIPVDQVRSDAAKLGQGGAIIQGRGGETGGGYTSFSLRTESLSRGDQDALQSALERELGATNFGFKNVSASFSKQILKSAIIAVFVSLALISIYITFRYQLAYAIPVLVALFHDLLVAMGVYSLSGREVTASSVAALLTILGYSIYDTIIIFDRVRENTQIMRRSSFAAIANQSLWETIRRSIATTVITLLPVFSLLIFGGSTLQDFAFAIFVGVASGAYSTIFIATPLLTVIKEREPEFQRRKDAGLVEKMDEDDLETGPAAFEPEPEPVPVAVAAPVAETPPAGDGGDDGESAAQRREARRKRRRARPHGRAR